MRKTIKRTVVTGAIAAGLVLGGAGVVAAANAATPAPSPSPSVSVADAGNGTTDTGTDNNGTEKKIAGSIAAPPEAAEAADGTENKANEVAQEAAEADALKALATITPDAASAAALAAVPGTAGSVTLGDEDGFVVYDVHVTGANGTVTEVIVDAGNGSVLAQQVEDANDAAETPGN